MDAGKAQVSINFSVDTDGILTVTATETTQNISQEIQVKPSYGLNTEEMHKMLVSSHKNAKSDMLQRMLKKAYVDIEQFIDTLNKIPDDQTYHLSKTEKTELSQICTQSKEDAKTFLTKNNLPKLDKLHKTLKQQLDNLCIRRVSKITNSLKGKTIAEINHLLHDS